MKCLVFTFSEEFEVDPMTNGGNQPNCIVCPPVRGDTPQAVASGLSPVKADNTWNRYVRLYKEIIHKL